MRHIKYFFNGCFVFTCMAAFCAAVLLLMPYTLIIIFCGIMYLVGEAYSD